MRIVFVFSLGHCKFQEKLETMLMQKFGEQTKMIMVFSKVAYVPVSTKGQDKIYQKGVSASEQVAQQSGAYPRFPSVSLTSARTTVILGDSIIQNLQGVRLRKETKQRVVVKSFRGATTQDMKSFIQPTINNAPDKICLHMGTNAIVDLAKTIQCTCGAEVVLSELTTRKDARKESVKSVNKLLIKYSKQHHWSLVRHCNIKEKVLNRGGLHLTKQGNELLYKNFASCLVAKEANDH